MQLTGLHLLLSYQCTFECDHCFVWGSPWQKGTMTLEQIGELLKQARQMETVRSIYFEGGEPFLFYPVLLAAVRMAVNCGFRVGIVSNAYWATSEGDAIEWLQPFDNLLEDLSVSSDLFHYSEKISQQVKNATTAARELGIPMGTISIAKPETGSRAAGVGQLPEGESGVMYRGRAVEKLAPLAPTQPWKTFTECPYEDLVEPGRIHVDALGNLHICQGIVIGNWFETPLAEICTGYDPHTHPIVSPLLAGGPAELARRYGVEPRPEYADACHLCYETRRTLRSRFPNQLSPDQMYGILE